MVNQSHKLTKVRLSSKDNKGCQFHYWVYTAWDFGKVTERLYMDDIGFNIRSTTLKELKDRISERG